MATAFLGVSFAGASGAMALPDDSEGELYTINASDIGRVPHQFRRQEVAYSGAEKPGTIVIDTANRHLYLVQPGGEAIRYGIGVGRQGFSWSGRANVRWKAKWPKWTPPAEMVKRDPVAAKWADGMPGGPTNPLGARALYLFQGKVDTLYRIHGTNDPRSIGKAVSSGCIRLLNVDVADLYERVPPGTPVVVLQGRPARSPDRLMVNREVEKPVKPEKPLKPEKSAEVKRNFNLN